jgi:hypothetical protein
MTDFNLDGILAGAAQVVGGDEFSHITNQTNTTDQINITESKTINHETSNAFTPDEHARILKKYTPISKQIWRSIPLDTYIRYIDSSNLLQQGGRVIGYVNNTSGEPAMLVKKQNWNRAPTIATVDINSLKGVFKFNEQSEKKEKKEKKTTKSTTTKKPKKTKKQIDADSSDDETVLGESVMGEPIVGSYENPRNEKTRHDDILDKLGTKLLFEEGEILKKKVENLECEVSRLNEESKKIVVVVNRLYRLLETHTAMQAAPNIPDLSNTPINQNDGRAYQRR